MADARLARFDAAHESSSRRTSAFWTTLLKRSTGPASRRGTLTARAFHVSLVSSACGAEDCGSDSCHVVDRAREAPPNLREDEMTDEKTDLRYKDKDEGEDVEAHRYVSEEPGDDEAE